MSRWLVEKRLSQAAERLKLLRQDLGVAEEQISHLADVADDARMRALVSETPLADREHHEARRHLDAMVRHRRETLEAIAELERTQDELLDRLIKEAG